MFDFYSPYLLSTVSILSIFLFTTSHIVIPAATDTFNECLVPHWGISTAIFTISKILSSTPFISCPNIIAIGRGKLNGKFIMEYIKGLLYC